MIQNEIIEELVLGLNRIIGDKLDCVILYGSVARGDDRDESDVDIAFVVKTCLNDEMKNAFFHWNACLDMKYNRIFSIIDIERESFDKWGDIHPFYKSIRTEGIVLWKAA